MMARLLSTLVLCFNALWLVAQTDGDIVYLKDGTIYRGLITEYLPNEHIVIKLLDDRVIEIKAEHIMRMTMGNDQVIKKQVDTKAKGYFHNSLLGLQFGNSGYYNTSVALAYNMVNGYRLKQHHAGLGLGAEGHLGRWYAPVYADYSYHILKGRISPMLGVNGGFMLPLSRDLNTRYDFRQGSFVGGRLGFVAYSNPHFAVLLNVTYRYIHLSGAEYSSGSPWFEAYNVNGEARIHRVGIMLGLVIN